MSTMIPHLRSKGVEAIGFNFAPRIFQTKKNIFTLPRQPFGILKFSFSFLYHLLTADVVHWVYGSGSLNSRPLLFIVSVLKRRKFVEYCGTDVRSLEKLCDDVPFYQLDDFTNSQKALLGTSYSSRETQTLFKVLGFMPMPNSPELEEYILPEINPVYFPVTRSIDLERFSFEDKLPANEIPLVVHVPTSPEIKGTVSFLKAAEELEKEGKIHFKVIQNISPEEALGILRQADIVVDQLMIGEYGVLSIEAMALGKPVICFIRPALMSHYQSLKPALPIVNANVRTIKEVLLRLSEDKVLRADLGKRGLAYVQSHHSAVSNADRLIKIYSGEVDPSSTIR